MKEMVISAGSLKTDFLGGGRTEQTFQLNQTERVSVWSQEELHSCYYWNTLPDWNMEDMEEVTK